MIYQSHRVSFLLTRETVFRSFSWNKNTSKHPTSSARRKLKDLLEGILFNEAREGGFVLLAVVLLD